MPKIRVKVDNLENIVEYTIEDEIINYKENDGTKVSYNLKDNLLIRDNDDIHMTYDFNNKKGVILIKEFAREIELILENVDITKEKNNIRVNYSIENNDIMYELEVLE